MSSEVTAEVRRRLLGDGPGSVAGSVAGAGTTVGELVRAAAPLVAGDDLASLEHEVVAALRGLGPLDPLMRRDDVTDVLVGGSGDVWVEEAGVLRSTGVCIEERVLMAILERVFRPLGVPFDRSHPDAEGLLADGSRLTAVLPPVAVDGPIVAIRKFTSTRFPIAAFAGPRAVALLEGLVDERVNLVVFGATGSGKTSLVNALADRAARTARLVVIEDVPELEISGQQVVRLQTRRSASGAPGDRSMGDLVRLALRLRPDRLVVGEVRGPEAEDMIWALSTGHTGSLSTVHARSAAGSLSRLRTFCAMSSGVGEEVVRAQVHAAVDVLVGMRRGRDGTRVVSTIVGVGDQGELSILFDVGDGS